MSSHGNSDWSTMVTSETDPKKCYKLQSKEGVISCSCQSWKNQPLPITCRTCKHLIGYLGDYEEEKRAPNSYHRIFEFKRNKFEKNSPMSYHTYDGKKPVIGWFASVKLNGMFARWKDGQLTTKSGRPINAPDWITDKLPRDAVLDGEIYHWNFQKVRKAVLGDKWDHGVEFVVFDLVDTKSVYSKRLHTLKNLYKKCNFKLVVQYEIKNQSTLKDLMTQVVEQKEEGLVLRDPNGKYEPGKRSWTTLKWKPTEYGNATIVKITPKKIGCVLSLRDQKHSFNVYTHRCNFRTKTSVEFSFSGRDDNDNPELVKILK